MQNELARKSPDTALSGLLHAVRLHLWRQHFRRAAESALWSSAVLLVVAASTHLLLFPVRLSIVLTSLVVVWIGASIWAMTRRPADSVCALWADRQLGGASAFSTCLEVRMRNTAPSSAVRSLDAWTRARIPQSLALLARRREPHRLMQSVVAASAALLVTVLVLAIPRVHTVGGTEPQVSTTVSHERIAIAPVASAPADSFANELASALRPNDTTTSRGKPVTANRTSTGREADDSITPAATSSLRTAGRANDTPDNRQKAGSDATPGQQAGPSAAATGREAGGSRDQRAEPGVSPLLRGGMAGQRIEVPSTTTAPAERADADESSAFSEVDSASRALKESTLPVAPAAMPPIDNVASGMSPSRAAYVRAWTKALSKTH